VGDETRQYGRLYPVARAVLRPLFKAAWRIGVAGLDRLPSNGPAILCPNHTSVIDSFILPAVLPRRITFVGKAEYLDSWKTRYLLPALGMIPIDRSGGDASRRALDAAADVLDRGELFGIYPEGTRSRDGVLHKGRTGAARLALRTGAPLVPVGIVGTRDIQPPGARFPRLLRRCEIRVGAPIDAARYGDAGEDRLALRKITDELMFEIRELSGQDYVDEYAGSGGSGGPRVAAVAGDAGGPPPPAGPGAEPPGSLVDDESIDARPSSADVLPRPA
jgi:1-acyl-sn-glycerol-3-phosphate acyltransferase